MYNMKIIVSSLSFSTDHANATSNEKYETCSHLISVHAVCVENKKKTNQIAFVTAVFKQSNHGIEIGIVKM